LALDYARDVGIYVPNQVAPLGIVHRVSTFRVDSKWFISDAVKGLILQMVKKGEKDPHAVALGRKGGKARIDKMTPERRSEIARKAVLARWAKHKKDRQKPD
jgi:hypothetical protein